MTREPVTLVEIERDVCTLSFGVAPCTAAGTPCYNTWKTCQDRTNFAAGVHVLRFVKPRSDIPLGWDAIPSVVSTSSSPTELNVGDVDASSGPLGKRAQASITFADHPTSDIQLDPYVSIRPGDPFARGTFWTKLKARWPTPNGRKIRILDGDITQAPSDMIRREYLLDRIDGPDARGRVTVRAVDPLRILDDKTSQAPPLSRGELASPMGNGSGPHTVIVSGNLVSEYPASGTLRIGSELMTYTARALSGTNTHFTGITRATDGTAIASHEVESRVQTCIRYTNVNAWEVARSLIQIYAPAAYPFIDQAQWTDEAAGWLNGFIVSSVISSPTGLNQLLAELCRDAQFFIWWDERQQKILLKAVRPPTEVPVTWTDEANIIAGSQSLQQRPEERISQIWYYYQPRDLSKSVTDEANYRKVRIRVDGNSESVREYQSSAVTKIFSRWVRTDAIVTAITTRLLNRYRDEPYYLTISLDKKDRGLWTADIVDVSTRLLTNSDGLPQSVRYQIISAEEVGAAVKYVLQNFGSVAQRGGFWMATDAPIYSAATEAQRLAGGWWADDAGRIGADNGYEWQ